MNHLGADFNHLYLWLKQSRQKCAGCFNLKLWPDTNANILFNVFLLFWKLSNGLLVTWYRIILPITSDAGSFRGGTSGSRRAEWMKFGFGEMSFRSERWNLSLRKHRHHIQTRREMRRSNLLADLDRFLLRCRGCLFQTSLALVSFHKSLKIPNVGIFPPQVLSRWRKIWIRSADQVIHWWTRVRGSPRVSVLPSVRYDDFTACGRASQPHARRKELQDLRTRRSAASLCSNLGGFQSGRHLFTTEPQKQTAGYFLCLQSHFFWRTDVIQLK